MRAADRTVFFAVLLALAAQALWAGVSPNRSPAAEPSRPQTLVVMVADQSLYLCPLCGEQFLAAYRLLAARHGKDGVWVVVSPDLIEDASEEMRAAVVRRIRIYLRSSGCPAPVLLDRSGFFNPAGSGTTTPGLVLDAVSGSVENLASAPYVTPGKRP